MSFEKLLGNEQIKTYLQGMVAKGAIPNSLLFAGLEGVGKGLFAEAFAHLLLYGGKPACQSKNFCADLRIFRPSGKLGLHTIDAMRKFSEEVYLAPFNGAWKVFIIHDADRMLPSSANALLKTFEEPASHSLIILLSSHPSALLPTILSRCQVLRFQPISEQVIADYLIAHQQKSHQEAHLLASQAEGSLAKAIALADQEVQAEHSQLLSLLSSGRFNSYADLQKSAQQISAAIDKKKKEIEKESKKELLAHYSDTLTASQRELIEKEIEGSVALYSAEKTDALLFTILSWYRDLHLLYANGNRRYLSHPDYLDQLEQTLQQPLLPFEKIEEFLRDAKRSLQRSIPLNICLETLFLKLNKL